MTIDRERYLERHRRYNSSEKGLARHRRYNASERGRETRDRYEVSEQGREVRHRYYHDPANADKVLAKLMRQQLRYHARRLEQLTEQLNGG